MSVITVDNKIYDEMAAYAQMNNLSINEAVTVGLRAFLRNFKKSEVAPKKKYYISSAVKALETNFKCPVDLSPDYKDEIAEARMRKCL